MQENFPEAKAGPPWKIDPFCCPTQSEASNCGGLLENHKRGTTLPKAAGIGENHDVTLPFLISRTTTFYRSSTLCRERISQCPGIPFIPHSKSHTEAITTAFSTRGRGRGLAPEHGMGDFRRYPEQSSLLAAPPPAPLPGLGPQGLPFADFRDPEGETGCPRSQHSLVTIRSVFVCARAEGLFQGCDPLTSSRFS